MELCIGSGVPGHPLLVDVELGVTNLKWCVIRREGVFSRAHEEIEGKADHVGNGSKTVV